MGILWFPTVSQDYLVIAGFRPGSRDPFVSAKGPKTIDAPPVLTSWTDPNNGKADQLAALTQGPQRDKSVRPWGRAAGVGKEWDASNCRPYWSLCWV